MLYASVEFIEVGLSVQDDSFVAFISRNNDDGVVGFECVDDFPVSWREIGAWGFVFHPLIYLLDLVKDRVAQEGSIFRGGFRRFDVGFSGKDVVLNRKIGKGRSEVEAEG